MRAARLLVGPALLLTAAVLGASCDVGVPALDDPSRGFDRPPVRVLRAEIVSGYDADSRPIYQDLVEGAEAPSEVPISGSLRITFDRFLLPHKVLRQSLCVHPTTTTINTLADCAEPFQPFTGPTYDPIDRTVTYRLDPQTRLSPDTRYRVSLFVPANLDDNGFFAFDGAPLDRAYSFDFVTQPEGGDDVQEVLPNRANYCAAQACFAACSPSDIPCLDACRPLCVEDSCAFNGDLLFQNGGSPLLFQRCGGPDCHGGGNLNPNPGIISMGLDLNTAQGIAETAIGQVAHQTMQGEGATAGDVSPARFGRAMPLIDPGNPGNSYVLYKVAANPLNHPRPGGALAAETALEIDRLRNGVVVGLPMPAQQAKGAAQGLAGPLPDDPEGDEAFAQAKRMSAWIASGAPLSCP